MVKTLTIKELFEKHSHLKPSELILDVRRADEFAAGHVPGSKNISHETVCQHAEELKKYETVYLYCRSGARVQKASYDLICAGIKNLAAVVDGGMPDWESHGYPIEK